MQGVDTVRSWLWTLVIGFIGFACLTLGSARSDDDPPGKKSKTQERAFFIPLTKIAAPEKRSAAQGTHEQVREIVVKPENGNSLQTICPGIDGQVLALVARPRYGPAAKPD